MNVFFFFLFLIPAEIWTCWGKWFWITRKWRKHGEILETVRWYILTFWGWNCPWRKKGRSFTQIWKRQREHSSTSRCEVIWVRRHWCYLASTAQHPQRLGVLHSHLLSAAFYRPRFHRFMCTLSYFTCSSSSHLAVGTVAICCGDVCYLSLLKPHDQQDIHTLTNFTPNVMKYPMSL